MSLVYVIIQSLIIVTVSSLTQNTLTYSCVADKMVIYPNKCIYHNCSVSTWYMNVSFNTYEWKGVYILLASLANNFNIYVNYIFGKQIFLCFNALLTADYWHNWMFFLLLSTQGYKCTRILQQEYYFLFNIRFA